jgi:MFS family permease
MRGGASRAAFACLLGLAALDAAGYSVIAPVVPAIARKTDAGPALVGALVTTFAVGQLVGYPLAGRGIRRRHAAAVLAAALALVAAGDLGFVLGNGLDVYFPSRFVQGIGAGGLWMGITFGVLERYPDEAYRRLSQVTAAYSLGSVAGPAIGAIGGIHGPFAAHLVLIAAGAGAVVAIGAPPSRARFGSDRAALRAPGFLLACAGILAVALSLGTLEGPLALHFGSHLSQSRISAVYAATAIVVGISAAAAAQLPWRPALAGGVAVLSACVAVLAATGAVAVWLPLLGLLGIGFGLAETGSLGALLETVGTSRMVLAMVVWSQVWGIGYLAGPAAGGGLAQAFGAWAIGLVSLVAAVLVATAFASSVRERATR